MHQGEETHGKVTFGRILTKLVTVLQWPCMQLLCIARSVCNKLECVYILSAYKHMYIHIQCTQTYVVTLTSQLC